MQAPITALYAAICALFIAAMVLHVATLRRRFRVGIGDGGERQLALAVRAHGNAVETIPIALILLLMLELNQGQTGVLHAFGTALIVGRFLHAFGLSRHIGISFGRFWGTITTLVVIVGLAVANLVAFWLSVQK